MIRLKDNILSIALEQFGFSETFVTMTRNIHDGPIAQFFVNGEMSNSRKVLSGIRQVSRCIYCFLLYSRKCCRRRWMVICRRWALACPEVEGHVTEFGIRRRLERFYAWGAPVVARIEYIVSIRSIVYLKDLTNSKQNWFFNISAHKDTFFGVQILGHDDTTRYLSTQWERQVSQM